MLLELAPEGNTSYWDMAKAHLRQVDFRTQLQGLDHDNVPESIIADLLLLMGDLSADVVTRVGNGNYPETTAGRTLGLLWEWVQGIVTYHRISATVKPMMETFKLSESRLQTKAQ